MKTLTVACLLLSFCATSAVAVPSPQSNRQTSAERKCSAGFKECKESLNAFKEADQFMRLKATVLADLNRMEKSSLAKAKGATGRVVDINRQTTGNVIVLSATVGPIRNSSVQAKSAVLPVSSMPAGSSKP